ncbi:MAG: hypothetical protein ACK4MH_12225 [Brevundimonas sp.]|uniref:hypothetical protein n=1 Tax=Brevundimonas sp. TaxID=1871086 RepID=UPI00391C0D79
MTATAIGRSGQVRLDWRRAGLAATAVGLNAGAIALLSLTDLGPRNRPLRNEPMIVYLDEAWPRLVRPPQAVADVADRPASATPLSDMTPTTRDDSPGSHISETAPASAPSISHAENDAIDARWRVGAVTPGSNGAILSCDAPQRLSPEARRRCEERWAGRENARAIVGTENAERDATFARHGARRLAAWKAQRAMPARGDPSCERPNPVAGCEGVNVQVELFSSRDGFLPNLRKRRE